MCFIKNADGTGIYFDNYGYPPYNLPEMSDVFEDCTEWVFNNTPLQTPYSAVCGAYCIFVISHIAKGFTMDYVISLLNDAGDTYSNDALVFNYIKHKYSKVINTNSMKAIDLSFIFNQKS